MHHTLTDGQDDFTLSTRHVGGDDDPGILPVQLRISPLGVYRLLFFAQFILVVCSPIRACYSR